MPSWQCEAILSDDESGLCVDPTPCNYKEIIKKQDDFFFSMKSHHSSIIMVKQKTLEYKAIVVYTKKKKLEYFVRNNNDDHHGRLNIYIFYCNEFNYFLAGFFMTQIKPCFECNIDNEFDDLTSSKFILLRITPE